MNTMVGEIIKSHQVDVVFFDMDHTILDIDCSVSWKNFLVDIGMAPEEDRSKADHYWDLYCKGKTPIDEFVDFQYREFIGRKPQEMLDLSRRHFDECIAKYIYPQAQQVLDYYREKNIPTVLVTGTNRYIAQPIIEAMRITALLPTEPEIIDGVFTGGYIKPFLLKQGKIFSAQQYCEKLGITMGRAAFYADSINDLEMLECVGFPVVVNPGEKLRQIAKERHWPIGKWLR
ncbi:MAG: haloacid dehalogenase-like hydrolase [Sedimentisphaerales bacterium]|nr:haloacid dehalogenase-like hydrolase [Sedimentisphaerales bacterium]